MKAFMTAAIFFFVLGVSIGRSRFSSSEVYDDADDVTIPGKFTDCEVTYHSLIQVFNCSIMPLGCGHREKSPFCVCVYIASL